MRCFNLDQQNADLKSELEIVKKQNFALKNNISSIFKTAKLELNRKDQQLKELQQKCVVTCTIIEIFLKIYSLSRHDSLIFRRSKSKGAIQPPSNNIAENNEKRIVESKGGPISIDSDVCLCISLVLKLW